MRHLYATALLSIWMALPASADPVTATWDPPTDGGPVAAYVLEVSRDGGEFRHEATVLVEDGDTDPVSITIDAEPGTVLVGRVYAKEAHDHAGPRSPESAPFTVPLLPGAPGAPRWSITVTIEGGGE